MTDYFVLTVIQVKKCITQEEEKPFSDLIRLQNVVFQITASALFCARLEKKRIANAYIFFPPTHLELNAAHSSLSLGSYITYVTYLTPAFLASSLL